MMGSANEKASGTRVHDSPSRMASKFDTANRFAPSTAAHAREGSALGSMAALPFSMGLLKRPLLTGTGGPLAGPPPLLPLLVSVSGALAGTVPPRAHLPSPRPTEPGRAPPPPPPPPGLKLLPVFQSPPPLPLAAAAFSGALSTDSATFSAKVEGLGAEEAPSVAGAGADSSLVAAAAGSAAAVGGFTATGMSFTTTGIGFAAGTGTGADAGTGAGTGVGTGVGTGTGAAAFTTAGAVAGAFAAAAGVAAGAAAGTFDEAAAAAAAGTLASLPEGFFETTEANEKGAGVFETSVLGSAAAAGVGAAAAGTGAAAGALAAGVGAAAGGARVEDAAGLFLSSLRFLFSSFFPPLPPLPPFVAASLLCGGGAAGRGFSGVGREAANAAFCAKDMGAAVAAGVGAGAGAGVGAAAVSGVFAAGGAVDEDAAGAPALAWPLAAAGFEGASASASPPSSPNEITKPLSSSSSSPSPSLLDAAAAAAFLGHTGFLGAFTGLGPGPVVVVAGAGAAAVLAASAAGGAALLLPVLAAGLAETQEGLNSGAVAALGSRREAAAAAGLVAAAAAALGWAAAGGFHSLATGLSGLAVALSLFSGFAEFPPAAAVLSLSFGMVHVEYSE